MSDKEREILTNILRDIYYALAESDNHTDREVAYDINRIVDLLENIGD